MTSAAFDFCDDCGWQECLTETACMRACLAPPVLGLPRLSEAELLQLVEELSQERPRAVWIGVDGAAPITLSDDLAVMPAVFPLATRLTGLAERPAATSCHPSRGGGTIPSRAAAPSRTRC